MWRKTPSCTGRLLAAVLEFLVSLRRTSLEAGDWCGHFDAAGEKVWERGKDCKEGESHCRRSAEEQQLLLEGHVQANAIGASEP